jgi:hypothetical protein
MSTEQAHVASQPAPPSTPAPSASSTPSTNEFSIPESYTGKGWTEKVKSVDDLWKLADNSQSLLGRRVAPADDAPQEEWDAFYKTVGRPEAPDKYQLKDVEGVPEGFDLTEFKGKAQQLMFEAGLNQKQANALYQAYLKTELDVAGKNKEAIAEQNKKLDAEFDGLTKELFGDKFNEVSNKAQQFIKENIPEKLIPVVQGLQDQPQSLAAFIAFADNAQKQIADVKQKYGAEDNLASGQQTSSSTNREDVLKKLTETKLAAQKADPFSNDRKRLDDEIQSLRGQLQKFFK